MVNIHPLCKISLSTFSNLGQHTISALRGPLCMFLLAAATVTTKAASRSDLNSCTCRVGGALTAPSSWHSISAQYQAALRAAACSTKCISCHQSIYMQLQETSPIVEILSVLSKNHVSLHASCTSNARQW